MSRTINGVNIPKIKKEIAKNNKWRELYIDVLENGPKEENLEIALELTDRELIEGGARRFADNHIEVYMWRGPNMNGLRLLDELKSEQHKLSLVYRIKLIAFAVSAWAAGIGSAVIVELYKCT